MRKTILTILTLTLLFLFSGRVRAQDFITAGLTSQVAACPTNPGNSSSSTSSVTLSAMNAGGATFTIGSSAFSGTVSFFGSGDGGTTWQALNVFPSNSTTAVTTATAAGLWQANVAAYTNVCMAVTTFSSGTVTVTIRKATVSARAGGGGGGAAPAGATNSIQTNGGAGTLSSITNPTTPNSRAQVLTSTPSGGVGGTPAFGLPGDSPTDRPSGEASYTIGVTDIGTSIRETNVAGEAFTIPDGNTSGFVVPVNIGFIIEGGTSTIARTTSSQIRCTPNGALANTCNLTVGGQYILKETSDFNYTLSVSGDISGATLSSLTAATGTGGPLANGNNQITWNWAITTDAQDGLAFGETSAATGGTLTNGLANQAVHSVSTASNSTATPLEVAQGSITNTTATPAMQIETTWNNASLHGAGLVVQVINTASSATNQNSCGIEFLGGATGTTQQFCAQPNGSTYSNNYIVSNFYEGVNFNSAITFQGGFDVNQTTLAAGTGTFRGADNSGTGTSTAGGAATLRGGDATGVSANVTTGGSLTIRGGNTNSTNAAPIPGAVTITGGGLTAAATNVAGADVSIAGGLGTGNATPSHVKILSPGFVSASGTGAQANVTTFVIHKKAGSTSSATPTNMFNVPVAANQTAGFTVMVHVETTQATPHNCSTTEEFWSAVQNTSATVTQQTNGSITTGATICDTGTLTLAAAFSTANPAVFSVTPTWTTIVPTAVIITIEIHNLSQQDVTLL